MKKYFAMFLRKFEVEIEADDIKAAEVKARIIESGFPGGTCKLHSIKAEDYVEPVDPPSKPGPRGGKPTGGGSPGTPTLHKAEIVEAQAKVA